MQETEPDRRKRPASGVTPRRYIQLLNPVLSGGPRCALEINTQRYGGKGALPGEDPVKTNWVSTKTGGPPEQLDSGGDDRNAGSGSSQRGDRDIPGEKKASQTDPWGLRVQKKMENLVGISTTVKLG